MNKIRKIVSILLVSSMILQIAPTIICEAAENVYELVVNPETPLDEVYFYSNETENKKGYYYGFLDGKVSVMDEDYNFIKKSEFDMINSTELVTIKGKPAFVASKKIDGKYFYGIVSFDGETIIKPEYSWILINSEKSRITIEKKTDNQVFTGLWNLNCEEILPLEYRSLYIWDEKDDKLLIVATNKENKTGIILDNQMIWEEKETDGNHYYSYSFCEYENEKCIKISLYNDATEEHEDDSITLLKYDGSIIKEFSYEEWNRYGYGGYVKNDEEKYKEVCEEWLNKESENGKKHVTDFFKEKDITLSEIKIYTGFETIYNRNKNFYYWVIVTAQYPKSEKYKNDEDNFDTNSLTYTFIYNDNSECIISGRGFGKADIDENGKVDYYLSNMYRYLLSDNGTMRYFDKNTGKVEDLFEVNDNILTYVSDYMRYEDDLADKEIHKLYFYNNNKFEEIIEHIDNGDSKNYTYVDINDKRYLCTDYINNYCFIENDANGTDIFYCNEDSPGYDEWKLYKHEDISADEIIQYDKICKNNNLCLNDTKGEKIIFIGKNKNYQIIYSELGATGKVSVNDIIGDGNKKLVILEIDGTNKYFYVDLESEIYEKIDIDSDADKLLQDMHLINLIETDEKLYTCTKRDVVVIDKKTSNVNIILPYENFGDEINLNNRETFAEFIESLVILNNEVYIKYRKEYRKYDVDIDSDSNSCSIDYFYGIMNLYGEKKIPEIEDNSISTELAIVTNYIFAKNDEVSNVYDSSFNLIDTNANYFQKGNLSVIYSNNGSSDFTPKLFNKSTGKKIYDFANQKTGFYIYDYDIEILGKYYLLPFKDGYEKKIMIIDISSDKPVFYGKAFIHKRKNKIIIFGESEEIVYPTEKPTDLPTVSPSVTPIVTPSPVPSTTPTPKPSSGSSGGGFLGGGAAPVPSTTPTPAPSPSAIPVTTITPEHTQVPVITPEITVTPLETPEPSQIPEAMLTPSASPVAKEDNSTSSPSKLRKGLKITDKNTKAVYKIISIGKNKIVQYNGSTRKNSENVVIPASVKLKGKTFKVVSVGNGVFKNNNKLKSVKIGKNIKTIGKGTFSGCKKLADVKMGKNITSIKANAFSKCTSLTFITIPSKVKKIEEKAFYQCKNLRYIDVKTKKLEPGNIGSNAFGNGYGSPRVKTDKSVWRQYQNMLTSKGLSNKAVFIINPVKLVV